MPIRSDYHAVMIGLALSAGLAGCGPSGDRPSPSAFVPPLELARSALAASLQAWRDGKPDGPARASGAKVEVSDSERDPAHPLRDFTILGPIGTDERRAFAVRLEFDDPGRGRVERYLVLGRNPIWVFRQEDYDRIAHWEHKMEEPEDAEDGDLPAPHDHPHDIDAPDHPHRDGDDA